MALEEIKEVLWRSYSQCATKEEFEEMWEDKFNEVRDAPILGAVSECIRHSCSVTFWFVDGPDRLRFAFSCVKQPQPMHTYRFRNDKGALNTLEESELDSYLYMIVSNSQKIVVTDPTGEERSIERGDDAEWNNWKWASLA